MTREKMFIDSVLLELKEMKKLKMRVPKKAFEIAQNLDYDEVSYMKISEAADYCIRWA